MDALKAPLYTGFEYDPVSSKWNSDQATLLDISETQKDFMLYDNYTFTLGGEYTVATDFLGPLYFTPPNCLKKNYPNIPRMDTTGIAIISATNPPNNVMQKMQDYLTELNTW